LAECLRGTDLAIASTGTVTLECAWFGVPTVALYKTSWGTFQIGKRVIQVPYLAMPNLMASEELFPEFIQDAATPDNLVKAARSLLEDDGRRQHIKSRLRKLVADLGPPGASARAAEAILDRVYGRTASIRASLRSW
jgi:lipid-A-disaccharide synthase